MADFNKIFSDIKNALGPLAEKDIKEFANQGKQDAEAFLQQSRAKLAEWVQQLADKDIDEDEFRLLVDSQKAAAEMELLRAASAGTVRIEGFRDSVARLVVTTAVTAIAGG
jgi:serine/threonine protein kinase HipA of HipAB toxin-antitoxin module